MGANQSKEQARELQGPPQAAVPRQASPRRTHHLGVRVVSEASHWQLSPRSTALREAVLASLRVIRKRASTARVSDEVEDRIREGLAPGIGIVDRHEIRAALVCLKALRLVNEHRTGELEYSTGRRSSREHSRAARGSVTWSLVTPPAFGSPGSVLCFDDLGDAVGESAQAAQP